MAVAGLPLLLGHAEQRVLGVELVPTAQPNAELSTLRLDWLRMKMHTVGSTRAPD